MSIPTKDRTPQPFTAPNVDDARRLDCDVLVIGGGTAGSMAALIANRAAAARE